MDHNRVLSFSLLLKLISWVNHALDSSIMNDISFNRNKKQVALCWKVLSLLGMKQNFVSILAKYYFVYRISIL